jgi:CRP-like cAMP-binding protein
MEPLIPYMKKELFAQGEVLFHKGDSAEKIYYIRAGSVTVTEIDKELTEGSVFGEVGVFAPQRKRSASAICSRHSVIYSIHRDNVLQLYYQDPKFGLLIVRLLSRYVAENVDTILEFRNRPMVPS